MNKFTTGMLVGGAAAIMGVGYLMQDKKTYRKMAKKWLSKPKRSWTT